MTALAYQQRRQVMLLLGDVWAFASMIRPIDDRERTGAADGGPSVLLVVLDTCRADKFGAYGFERETTPAMDELARDPDAVTFLNSYVQAPWTKPSTASLFTGLFPRDHGVVIGHLRAAGDSERLFQTQLLSPEAVTIAEAMSDAGFYTFGVVVPHHLGHEYGFAQGFDEYHGILSWAGDDPLRLRTATALIEAVTGKFFGYVHFIGCHAPYKPEHRVPEYMARYGFEYDEEARKEARVDFTTTDILAEVNDRGLELSEQDVTFLHLIYEAKLRWTDQELMGPLVQSLKDSGRYDDTLIIVTADHGEELYEHGKLAHGHALWDELVRVPLIVKYPKGQKPEGFGSHVSSLISSVDLYPSIMALAGLPAPQGLRGVPALRGVFARHAFAEDAMGCSPEHVNTCRFMRTLVTDEFKLVVEPGAPPRLFSLADDPDERHSLAADFPDRVASMSSRLKALEQEAATTVSAPSVDMELGEQDLRTLRGLGYVQ